MDLIQRFTSIKSYDLRCNFTRADVLKMVRGGEYNATNETLAIEWDSRQIKRIAEMQLTLVADDIRSKPQDSDDYISAVSFIETERFENLCEFVGLNNNDAYDRAHYLIKRYTSEYKLALEQALHEENITVESVDVHSIEFALELATLAFTRKSEFIVVTDNCKSLTFFTDLYQQYLIDSQIKSSAFRFALVAYIDAMESTSISTIIY
ncbi:hypothetical protein EIJ81_00870 (plasmid) [Aliivibrio salmonicida]|uniref:hypothetical protein n=1 Tax=Aliivibrio salmonicida TaxID=40269 RepID=UPI000F6C6231|nr:hypothetical protein [Aliivibrio salmonicida]AZL83452.1 hypothetical protein EIJ81_00870 [Aliivibrio salmonicida]